MALFVWVAASLLEYVILGSSSFIWMDDEGELLVTHYHFLGQIHPGGQYSHLMQSGLDAQASFFFGSAYLSLDRYLLNEFPLWIGIAIHKAVVFTLGAGGTYRLCRSGFGASRISAVVFGTLFTVLYHRMQFVTFGTGLSLALLPLGVYFCVVRQGHPRYWLGVLVYAALLAGLSSFHGIPPFATAVIAAMILMGKFHIRAVVGSAIAIVAFLVNNAESFNALISMGPTSVRGSANFGATTPFAETFLSVISPSIHSTFISAPLMSGAIVLSGLVFACRRDWPLFFRVVAAFSVPPISMALFHSFPWQEIGLSPIRNAPFDFAVFGLLPIAAVVGACTVERVGAMLSSGQGTRPQWVSNAPAFMVLLIAATVLLHYKAHNFNAWRTTAGQSIYATIDNLLIRPWASAEPFRAISLRHKQMQPEPNILMSFYGVPMFDAWVNLVPINHAAYWRYGIHRRHENWTTDLGLDWRFFGEETRFHFRLGEMAPLALLAVANVRYVFSPVPLENPRLRYIDGPPHPPLDKGLLKATGANRTDKRPSWRRTLDRWRWQFGRVVHYGKVYIYELADALPRVFAARGVSVVPAEMGWTDFLMQVEKLGLQRIAVVREADAQPIIGHSATAKVAAFDLVVDGFDIEIDAPEGGIIVINAVDQPFFKATVDGMPAPIVSVNGIQIAVPVPPGSRNLRLRYHRPTVGERLRKLF